jgi:hypothetical protein
VKRLFAVVLGALGISAWLRRRRRPEPELEASPADGLRAKLAETREEPEQEQEPETPAEASPSADDVASRRSDVHDRARQAMSELRDEPE